MKTETAARVTLKAINDELGHRGYTARLTKGSSCFYFQFGEAADWLDRTVDTKPVCSRTAKEWIDEFRRLKKLNQQIHREAGAEKGGTEARLANRRVGAVESV